MSATSPTSPVSARRALAMAAVAVIVGAMAAPAGAHITRKVGHAWKHLKPKALALVTWGNLTGVPAGFADGVDNDNNAWPALTGVPAGFADGVDDVGPPAPPAWLLGGNGGTTAGTNFLGTTDNQALEIKVNGQRVLRLEPTATSPNVIAGFPGNSANVGVEGATIGGGGNPDIAPNSVTADYGTVGGGFDNHATGNSATIPGGAFNIAAGDYSFAAGIGVSINPAHDGSFLFADQTPSPAFNSAAANEFAVRASGGTRIYSKSNLTTGVLLAANSGTWSSLSDRNAKEGFAAIDAIEVLDLVAELPVATWRYRGEPSSVRHLGPVSQDFRAAFGLGRDERHIDTVDADGVALAAIQGLNEKVDAMEQGRGTRSFPVGVFALGGLSAFGLVALGAGLGLAFARRRRIA